MPPPRVHALDAAVRAAEHYGQFPLLVWTLRRRACGEPDVPRAVLRLWHLAGEIEVEIEVDIEIESERAALDGL